MNVRFLVPARAELERAVAYYNSQSEGLGFEFAAEAKRTLERITRYPNAWHRLSQRARRCRMNRFPYALVYQIKNSTILIVAVMHFHQRPYSWESRLQ